MIGTAEKVKIESLQAIDFPGDASCALVVTGSTMSNLDFGTHRALVGIKERNQRLARRAFDQRHEAGRAQYRGHSAGGEIDHVLLGDDEFQFARGTDFGS